MTSTVFIDVVTQNARAAMTGVGLPSVSAKLLTHLAITARFFSGETIVDVTEAKCVIKPKETPSGAAALLDTTAAATDAGTPNAAYTFEWDTADSVQLRAALDGACPESEPRELRCEIEYRHNGKKQRAAFPIHFATAYLRDGDAAPDATADTSWQWLKDRAPQSNGFIHDDEQKTLTVEPSASTIGDVIGLADALAGKAAVSHTHAQSEVTGLADALASKAAVSHTHAQSDITGLAAALAGKAAASHTHAQSEVTGLAAALAGKAAVSHAHAQSEVTGLDAALASKAAVSHTHAQSEVTGLAAALATKGAALHVVTGELTQSTEIPATPAEYLHSSGFPFYVEISAGASSFSATAQTAQDLIDFVYNNFGCIYLSATLVDAANNHVLISSVDAGAASQFTLNSTLYSGQDSGYVPGVSEVGTNLGGAHLPLHVWVDVPSSTTWPELFLEAYMPSVGWVAIRQLAMGSNLEGLTDALVSWPKAALASDTYAMEILSGAQCQGLRLRSDGSPNSGGPLRVVIVTAPVS